MSSAIEKLKKLAQSFLPGLKFVVDEPAEKTGIWWIDVAYKKKRLTVEHRPQQGFGFFDQETGFGSRPVEIYRTPELAARRLIQLFAEPASKSRRLTLKNVRELYSCSQVDLANKIGIKQSAVSRFEQRSEVKLGTLAAAIEALGGSLEVRARFPDADVPLSVKE